MNKRGNSLAALSMILAILIMGSWWLGRRSVQPLQSRNAPGMVAPTAGPLPNQAPQIQTQTSPEAQEPETRTIAVVLSRGLVRSTEQESRPVVIPPDVRRVQLEARFEGDYPHYQAVLQTAEGKRIWSKGDLEAQAFPGGKRILLYLSSSLLPPGDYILTLRGLPSSGNPETVAEYAFRVGKSQPGPRLPFPAWSKGSPSAYPARSSISQMFWPLRSIIR